MKRNLLFIIGLLILIAFVWLVTSIGIKYNKTKSIPIYYQNQDYNIKVID